MTANNSPTQTWIGFEQQSFYANETDTENLFFYKKKKISYTWVLT